MTCMLVAHCERTNATLVFRRDQPRSQLPPHLQLWKARAATRRGQRTLAIHRALQHNKKHLPTNTGTPARAFLRNLSSPRISHRPNSSFASSFSFLLHAPESPHYCQRSPCERQHRAHQMQATPMLHQTFSLLEIRSSMLFRRLNPLQEGEQRPIRSLHDYPSEGRNRDRHRARTSEYHPRFAHGAQLQRRAGVQEQRADRHAGHDEVPVVVHARPLAEQLG